jgi:hypothetical protein
MFLNITTSEKKIGFLLIETFRKLINPQNYGHLEAGGLLLFIRVSKNFVFMPDTNSSSNVGGHLRNNF